jgi:starch synthase
MTLAVLSVASEAVPLVKTGGLADVAGALPGAVAAHGVAMTTLLPGYPAVMAGLKRGKVLHAYDDLLGEPARLVAGKLGAHPLIVLDAPSYFARDGGPYAAPGGRDWDDNWRRFAALARAGADIVGGAIKGLRFDVLHAHDWQAALAPAYLRFAPPERAVPTVVTVHNMAFQGNFAAETFAGLGLPAAAWSIRGVEYHGGVGFLKAGLEAASAITTVSPSYAAEIRQPEFGMGLEQLITGRGDDVRGIVNGIDTAVWNPATDPALAQTYTARTLAKRQVNKRAIEAEFGLEAKDGPIFAVVSRLTAQKGVDVLLEAADHLVGIGGRLAVLGSGDGAIEAGFREAALRHPSRIGVRIGYDEDLSHRMQGGCDAILVPSRFEPCGLTQLYGLAYGCVPVVSRTGGLADTVIDANPAALAAGVATGVQFNGVHYAGLVAAISRTVALYRDAPTWHAIQRNGMAGDFSWARSGKAYADLYRQLVSDAG